MTERLKFLIFNASLLLKNEFKIKLVLLKPNYGDAEDKRLAFPASFEHMPETSLPPHKTAVE